jgi:hypothetical protein
MQALLVLVYLYKYGRFYEPEHRQRDQALG